MNRDELMNLPIQQLLEKTQSNVTPNAREGFEIAKIAYELAETPIEKGTAARQAGFRAEQANEIPQVVQGWFDTSRSALSSDEPRIKRELIATELLTGRAAVLRIERLGAGIMGLAEKAHDAFERGENILQEQHVKGTPWDRYGTMLSRHYATHEAMNGTASFAATTAFLGIWRAVRAEKDGTPESHAPFVIKQLAMNAAAGMLAISKPFARISKVSSARHKLASKLLG